MHTYCSCFFFFFFVFFVTDLLLLPLDNVYSSSILHRDFIFHILTKYITAGKIIDHAIAELILTYPYFITNDCELTVVHLVSFSSFSFSLTRHLLAANVIYLLNLHHP